MQELDVHVVNDGVSTGVVDEVFVVLLLDKLARVADLQLVGEPMDHLDVWVW